MMGPMPPSSGSSPSDLQQRPSTVDTDEVPHKGQYDLNWDAHGK